MFNKSQDSIDIKEYMFIFLKQPKKCYLEKLITMIFNYYNEYTCDSCVFDAKIYYVLKGGDENCLI